MGGSVGNVMENYLFNNSRGKIMASRETLFQYVFSFRLSFIRKNATFTCMNYESSPLCVQIFFYLGSYPFTYIYIHISCCNLS